eukprot:Pgem_evm1s6633
MQKNQKHSLQRARAYTVLIKSYITLQKYDLQNLEFGTIWKDLVNGTEIPLLKTKIEDWNDLVQRVKSVKIIYNNAEVINKKSTENEGEKG